MLVHRIMQRLWHSNTQHPLISLIQTMLLAQGQLLKNGQYQIQSLLGQGGFGITYRGLYMQNYVEVAIKELWPQGVREGTQVTWPPSVSPQEKVQQIHSFLVEAANQYQCQHSNIAKVYDYFEENNTAYIVLEFVTGKSLLKILEEEKVLDESRVKKYFLQIADALRVIHNNNFMHRDIKPDNILIDGNDDAMLIDFGAAREFIAGQTKKLTIILTPGYAPLEQYSTKSKRYPATDIYAFCASMYELLTGQLPIEAAQRVSSSPDPLIPPRQINPQISELMEQVILKGMNIKIQERFQSADALINNLSNSLNLTNPNYIQPFNQTNYQISTFPTATTMTARLIAKSSNVPIVEFAISKYALIGVFSAESGPVDIDLSLFPDSDTISKHHAEIYFQNGLWLVKDQSFNGTYIKPLHQTKFGERITLPTSLNSGDEIAFAKTVFIFQYP